MCKQPPLLRPQLQHEFLPLLLERVHIAFAEDALQSFVSGRVLFHVLGKLVVELYRQFF